MSIDAPFRIAREWSQLRWLSANEWITKIWCTYLMEYCSAIKKKNEVMKFAGKSMKLERILSSDLIQVQKDKCHTSSSNVEPSFEIFMCVFNLELLQRS